MQNQDKLTILFVIEIYQQTKFAQIAYKNIKSKEEQDTAITFSSIHSFLSHCAMLSKLLWSEESSKNSQNEKIADILNIPGDLLIRDTRFRNDLEHYDERLKSLLNESDSGFNMSDYNIKPKEDIKTEDGVVIRHFDPNANQFTMLGKEIDLGKLYDNVNYIKKRIENRAKNTDLKYIFSNNV